MKATLVKSVGKWKSKGYFRKLLFGFLVIVALLTSLMFISLQYVKNILIEKELLLQPMYIDLYIKNVTEYFKRIIDLTHDSRSDYIFEKLLQQMEMNSDYQADSGISSMIREIDDDPDINFSYVYLPDSGKIIDRNGISESEEFFFSVYFTGYFSWLNQLETVTQSIYSSFSVPLLQTDRQQSGVMVSSINYLHLVVDEHKNCYAILVVNVNDGFIKKLSVTNDPGLKREVFLTDKYNFIINSNTPFTRGERIKINPLFITKADNSFELGTKLVSFRRFTEYDDLVLFILTDKAAITKDISAMFFTTYAFLLLISIVGIFISVFIAGRMYAPLLELLKIIDIDMCKMNASIHFNELDIIRNNMTRIISNSNMLEEENRKQLPLISEHLLYKLLKNVEWSNNIGMLQDEHHIEFADGYYCSVIIKIIPLTAHEMKPFENEGLYGGIFDILRYVLLGNVVSILNLEQLEYVLIIYVSSVQAQKETLMKLSDMSAVLERSSESYQVVVACGSFAGSIYDIGKSYDEAKMRQSGRRLHDVFITASEEAALLTTMSLSAEFTTSLRNSIMAGNTVETYHGVEKILMLAEQKNIKVHQYLTLCESIAYIVSALAEDSNVAEADFSVRMESLKKTIDNGYSYKLVRQAVEDIAIGMAQICLERKKKNSAIDTVISYIDDNISKDISLEMVAEVAGLTPNYFTRYFKTQTGDTFVSYLSKRRIALAKKMLVATNMTVKEISVRVGCQGPNTFIKLFRKYEGVTPGAYKNLQNNKSA